MTPARALTYLAVTLVAAACLSGCATYSDTVRDAHRAVGANRPEQAVALINDTLEIDDSGRLPDEFDDQNVLLLLERATVLQSLGRFELSARDMMTVDGHLEWVSISDADTPDIAKYMLSGSAESYVAPAYERLLLNTLNMVNFLGMRDVSEAKVEARRFSILENFFLTDDESAVLGGILSLGNYLGGVAFEHAQDFDQAARYYSRAWYYGIRSPQFRRRLVDLLYLTGYKPRDLWVDEDEDALADILELVDTHESMELDDYRARYLSGDTLVIVQTGMSPWKKATRIPIVRAMSLADHARRGFSHNRRSQINALAAAGTLESVNLPMLTGIDVFGHKAVGVRLDDHDHPIAADIDIAAQVSAGYAALLPSLVVAAITRLVTRIVAGEASQAAVDTSGHSGLALLTKLAVEGSMNLADKPDTRSWMTLPGRIRLVRASMPPGAHHIRANIGRRSDSRDIDIVKNSINLVNFSRLR